jgi:hypothetical protein
LLPLVELHLLLLFKLFVFEPHLLIGLLRPLFVEPPLRPIVSFAIESIADELHHLLVHNDELH